MSKQLTKKEIKELEHMKDMSLWLDDVFRVPGTTWRFGLDPLIGLIPGGGDFITFVMSGMLLKTMIRHGASGKLVLKLMWNILLDTTIGSIPILGDVFDFYYKSNQRNLILMKEYYEEGKHQGTGIPIVLSIIGIFAVIAFTFGWLGWKIISWIVGWFH